MFGVYTTEKRIYYTYISLLLNDTRELNKMSRLQIVCEGGPIQTPYS